MTTTQAEQAERLLREAVEMANIPTLLMVLVHMTGDPPKA